MTNDMFATYDNVDEVIEWITKTLSGEERIVALTAAMVMYNTCVHMAMEHEVQQQKRDEQQFHREVD